VWPSGLSKLGSLPLLLLEETTRWALKRRN
jgi:hypothetical protein